MSEDNFDIYGDLDTFDLLEKFKLKNEDYKLLWNKYKHTEENLKKSEFEREELESKLATLEKSFGSLLITSRLEIKRKENQINELRKELDNIIFRRHVRKENDPKDNSKQHIYEKKHEEEERKETPKLENCSSRESAERRSDRDSSQNSRKRRRDSELDDRDKKRRRQSLEKDSRNHRYKEKAVSSRISTRSSSRRTDNCKDQKYERHKDVSKRDSKHRSPSKRDKKAYKSEGTQLRRSERSKNKQNSSSEKTQKTANSTKRPEKEQKRTKVLQILLEPLHKSTEKKSPKLSPKAKDKKESSKSSENNIKKINADTLINAKISIEGKAEKQVKSTDDKKDLELKNKFLLTSQTSQKDGKLMANEEVKSKLVQSEKKPNQSVPQAFSEIERSIKEALAKEFEDIQTRNVDKPERTVVLEHSAKIQEIPGKKDKCFEDILIDQLASENFGAKFEENDCVKSQSDCLENDGLSLKPGKFKMENSTENDERHEKPSQFFKEQDKSSSMIEEQEIKTEAPAIETKNNSEMQEPLSNNVFVIIPHNVVNSVNSSNTYDMESNVTLCMPKVKNVTPLLCENESEDNKNTDLIENISEDKNERQLNETKAMEEEIPHEKNILSSKEWNEIRGTPLEAPEKEHAVFASTISSDCTSTPVKLKHLFGGSNDLTDSHDNSSKAFHNLEQQMDDMFKENKQRTEPSDCTPIKGNRSEIAASKAKEMFDLYLASPVNIVPSEIEKDSNNDRNSSLFLSSSKKRRSSTPRKSLSGRGVKLVGHRIDGFEPGIRGEKALEASKLKTALFKEIFGAEDSENRSEETMNSTDKLEDIAKTKFDCNEISAREPAELLHFYIFNNTEDDHKRGSMSSEQFNDKDIYINTNDNTLETPIKYNAEDYMKNNSRATNAFMNSNVQKNTENAIESSSRSTAEVDGASSIVANQNYDRVEEMLVLNRFEPAIEKEMHLKACNEESCGLSLTEGTIETESTVETKGDGDFKQQENEKNSMLNTVITTGETTDSSDSCSSAKSQEWKDEDANVCGLSSEMRNDKVRILSVISIKAPIKRNLNQENAIILDEPSTKPLQVSRSSKESACANSDIAISQVEENLNQDNVVSTIKSKSPPHLVEMIPLFQAIEARNPISKGSENNTCKDNQMGNIFSDISSDDENSNSICGPNKQYQEKPLMESLNIMLNKSDLLGHNTPSQCLNRNLESSKEIGIEKFVQDFCRTIENVEEETVSDSIRSHTSDQGGSVSRQLNTSFGRLCKLGNDQKISTANPEKENIPQLIEPLSSGHDENTEIYSTKQPQSANEMNSNVYENRFPVNEDIDKMVMLNANTDEKAKTDYIENKEIKQPMEFKENFISNLANEMISYGGHESRREYITDPITKNEDPLQQAFSSLLGCENSNEALCLSTNDINTYAHQEEVIEETPEMKEANATATVKPVIRTISKKRKEEYKSPTKRTKTELNTPIATHANNIGMQEENFGRSGLTEGNLQKMLETFGQHPHIDNAKITLLKCDEKGKKNTRKKNNAKAANASNQGTQALSNADPVTVRSPLKTAATNEKRSKAQRTNNESPTKQTIRKCDKKRGKSVGDIQTAVRDIPVEDELEVDQEKNRKEKLTEKYLKSAPPTNFPTTLDTAMKKKSPTKQSLKSSPAKSIDVLNTPSMEDTLEKKIATSEEVSQNVKQVRTIQVEVAVKHNDPYELCNQNLTDEQGATAEENDKKSSSISDDLMLSTTDESSRNETVVFNTTGERKNISIASTNYIVESVSNDVVNVFITRKRKKKKIA